MENEQLVSIVVPVYCAEKYLKLTLDSILKQTYKNFELLLVDDGSTDGSGDICDSYSTEDSRIRVFHNPNSGGKAGTGRRKTHACRNGRDSERTSAGMVCRC